MNSLLDQNLYTHYSGLWRPIFQKPLLVFIWDSGHIRCRLFLGFVGIFRLVLVICRPIFVWLNSSIAYFWHILLFLGQRYMTAYPGLVSRFKGLFLVCFKDIEAYSGLVEVERTFLAWLWGLKNIPKVCVESMTKRSNCSNAFPIDPIMVKTLMGIIPAMSKTLQAPFMEPMWYLC